jgi:hypothetical protein
MQKYRNNLTHYREFNHFSTSHIAGLLKIPEDYYIDCEDGKRDLTYPQVIYLCHLYQIYPTELYNIDRRLLKDIRDIESFRDEFNELANTYFRIKNKELRLLILSLTQLISDDNNLN